METPKSLDVLGEQQIELIRQTFKAAAIDIDQDMQLTADQKLERFHGLLEKFEEAEANIPLNMQYQSAAQSFNQFYGRVTLKVTYLRRSKAGA